MRHDDGFGVLGPVEVVVAGSPARFSRPQHRDLFALLLLHANRAIPVDLIIDRMWGDTAPATATAQVQNMASAIRRAVSTGARLIRERSGYQLRVDPDRLDLSVFEGLTDAAGQASSPGVAAGLLREALALWRGVPLADVRSPYAAAARTRLEERRAAAREALFDAELAQGRHAEIVAEIADELEPRPWRERLAGQLMIALYRAGRQAEALATYQRTRRALAVGLGLEPGPALAELELLILRNDPVLRPPDAVGLFGLVPRHRTDTGRMRATGAGGRPPATGQDAPNGYTRYVTAVPVE